MDNPLLSSTEELSPEDRLLLTCTKRQEPQGEEHRADTATDIAGKNNGGSGYCHQVMALTRTKKKLVSSSSSSSDSESDSDLDEDEHHDMKQDHYYSSAAGGISSNTNSISSRSSLHRNSGTHPCNLSLDSNSHSAYNTLIIHQNNSSLLADTWIPASHEFTSVGMGQNRNSGCSASRKSQSPTRDLSSSLSQSGGCEGLLSERSGDSAVTSTELLDIPRDYLDQLTVLKHLAKEVQQDPISSSMHPNLLRSASFSRSQPDLTHATIMSTNPHSCSHDFDYYDCSKPQTCPQPQQAQQWKKTYDNQTPLANVSEKCEDVLPSVQILEILMRENSNLKAELANARRRIQTIHKLEVELTRLQKDHASLFESAERRESLERTARAKLTTEVKRLTAVNRELLSSSNSLQDISPYAMSSDLDAYKHELGKKDATLSQLISDNKELISTKERQEIELAAQRATLAEQRTHIDILDSALTNAQQNVLRLEEECRKKQEYVDKVSQLQRALSSLQLSNEKREQSEKKLRSQLESEITDLKLQLASVNAASNTNINRNQGVCSGPPAPRNYTAPPPYPGTTPPQQHQDFKSDLTPELLILQEKLKHSEDKIQSLQSVVARWEQFFTLEGQNGHNASQSQPGSTPNTPNSWSSRGETQHFFGNGNSSAGTLEDLPSTHNRAADLEKTIKDLESRLVERDAMIRVLHLQNAPPPISSLSSNLYSSFNSSSSSAYISPMYRESPCYSSVTSPTKNNKLDSNINEDQKSRINHQPSMSLASAMGSMGKPMGAHMDPALFYSKVTKCDSEPPSYANLPSKMRLGGSGSSLAKNSNESLGSVGQTSNASSSHKNSSPGSIDSSRSNTKSIDEQLKELDNQLLSKEVSGLKMQSGLCCIPGFSHTSASARKGKVPQSLLESISQGTMTMTGNSREFGHQHKKTSILPPLPKPPTSHNTSQNQSSRTSSGPPFISPSVGSSGTGTNPHEHEGHPTGLPLSNSVDSILTDAGGNKCPSSVVSGGTIFSPVSSLPKGLPPKSPGMGGLQESSKCKSLERDQKGKLVSDYGTGKYTPIASDAARCKSLDRREVKQAKLEEKIAKEREKAEKEKERKAQKSLVGSKAAFFGGLLTRRSPSPCRSKEKDKESTDSKVPIMQGRSVRFPFGKGSHANITPSEQSTQQQQQSHDSPVASADSDMDAAFLDMQGRSSQRNRISKWSLSSSNLASVQEQTKLTSGSDSPWNQRRSGGDPIGSGRFASGSGSSSSCPSPTPGDDKKWGKIVKTPFGLRYTFGSPRLDSSNSSSGSK
ncbi:unnamed protein product [Orchesella dallaii]|uniref:Angiomotin C-terminal domain-containing protein n=1 Tax=Orchesella dallaii TaxID=48710 RepID=A0ABP1QCS3_9HEXA